MRTRWQRVNRSLSVSEPSHLDFLRPACQQSAQHADSSATANHVSAFLDLHTLPALLWPPRKTAGWNGGALGMGGLAQPLHKFVQDCTLCQQYRCGQHLCAARHRHELLPLWSEHPCRLQQCHHSFEVEKPNSSLSQNTRCMAMQLLCLNWQGVSRTAAMHCYAVRACACN